ncbi:MULTISPECIES: MexX/AxyX family multidrug efflux RND transporter periplasmic adaptor subunit [Nitrosomonas]|uniref:HlyD family secretion protein n=1 Tax=Nitrosomonas europaea (strain ATCC 19718 / CIP 103999 / KCTC 2705 / NBRC 14298) TaxID=228410 RepID=Q82VH5_NITEU|nr:MULTISPECIES: MexX/AxyX family multidrug efflux RND transporter periplasmic adaptor subunit [Nitrosomonas]CAD85024.1 HlyD family secretion protein [Nitrosomonas europaea ATCC 19718]SDW75735.1 membrane fusion protein, multidrug efflux system [Nitrosomonas europaea]SET29615.1 membrane fusion protein, multidrug efflux system [Nitrosomonas europaea]SJZ86120.1 membrane fusion protein, multidrug efflux system [Nitrosomonas europaea]HBF26147.1 efflux RND transporter periplasmic adaptor subunit [Ni
MLRYPNRFYILMVLFSIYGLSGCNDRQSDTAANEVPPQVDVIITRVVSSPVSIELPGRLEAFRQAEVRARVAGIVTERLYKEGQDVRKGTPLFLINPELLKVARDEASGTLAKAEANYHDVADKLKRYKDLVSDHSISERDYQSAVAGEKQAKAELLSARARLEKARLDLGYATVVSPIDGRARRALVTEGALVGQDAPTPLTTIEQIDPIYVNFSQPATEVMAMQRAIKSGKIRGIEQKDIQVHLIFSDGSEYGHTGKLFFSDLAVDTSTDTVAMRALFDNPEYELLPGAYVQVRLEQAIINHAVPVPRDALVRAAGVSSVMIVDTEDTVQRVEVEANTLEGNHWVVTSGLQGGEKVIISNPAMMISGARVRPVVTDDQTDHSQQ